MSHPLMPLLRHLSELWHTSRTACVSVPRDRYTYERYKWVAKWFSTDHPEFSETCAYKAVVKMLARYPLSNDDHVIKFLEGVLATKRVS